MKFIKPSFEILSIMSNEIDPDGSLRLIERAGRVCYKSEDKIDTESSKKFIKNILKRGHESVIEHSAMTVKFICDRGVTHELVRHRLCAFSQESTRYVSYKDECTFIIPPWLNIEEGTYSFTEKTRSDSSEEELLWYRTMLYSENCYQELIKEGWSPQQARSVLPNSTKTEIVITSNFREWRHIFRLRCSKAAHPQMREIMVPLLQRCKRLIPVIFDDIKVEE